MKIKILLIAAACLMITSAAYAGHKSCCGKQPPMLNQGMMGLQDQGMTWKRKSDKICEHGKSKTCSKEKSKHSRKHKSKMKDHGDGCCAKGHGHEELGMPAEEHPGAIVDRVIHNEAHEHESKQ